MRWYACAKQEAIRCCSRWLPLSIVHISCSLVDPPAPTHLNGHAPGMGPPPPRRALTPPSQCLKLESCNINTYSYPAWFRLFKIFRILGRGRNAQNMRLTLSRFGFDDDHKLQTYLVTFILFSLTVQNV